MKQHLKTTLQGLIMGIVETIPGVSGSTLALIMGIYDNFIDFLNDLSNIVKTSLYLFIKKSTLKEVFVQIKLANWKFGSFLLLGMVIGVAIFANIMSLLLHHYPNYTLAFFFSLIVSSLIVPWREVKNKTPQTYLLLIVSAVAFYMFVGLHPVTIHGTPPYWLAFVSGLFAICAMLLPGISGSFILLLMGMYDYVITAVSDFTKLSVNSAQFTTLVLVGIGALIGFITFGRLLKIALKEYRDDLMTVLVGLMIGSLRVLWPYFVVTCSVPTIEENACPEQFIEFTRVVPSQMMYSESLVTTIVLFATVLIFGFLNFVVFRSK